MISFKVITEENKEAVVSEISATVPESEREEFFSVADSFDLSDEDVEIAISYHGGCALVRIFDMGRYNFLFPIALSDDADIRKALLSVAEYAMREEVPLSVCAVPADSLSFFSGFRHMNIDADDEECASYRVQVKTECELLDEIPQIVGERVNLCPLSEADIPLYAELSKDYEVNKYWGYNYAEDNASPSDEYFFENAEGEFMRGVAFSMAVRHFDRFIGECTFYAFDGRGCAEFSIRLLREYHGQGLGSEATELIFEVARQIGLVGLRARVSKKNEPSIAMLSRFGECESVDSETLEFSFEL